MFPDRLERLRTVSKVFNEVSSTIIDGARVISVGGIYHWGDKICFPRISTTLPADGAITFVPLTGENHRDYDKPIVPLSLASKDDKQYLCLRLYENMLLPTGKLFIYRDRIYCEYATKNVFIPVSIAPYKKYVNEEKYPFETIVKRFEDRDDDCDDLEEYCIGALFRPIEKLNIINEARFEYATFLWNIEHHLTEWDLNHHRSPSKKIDYEYDDFEEPSNIDLMTFIQRYAKETGTRLPFLISYDDENDEYIKYKLMPRWSYKESLIGFLHYLERISEITLFDEFPNITNIQFNGDHVFIQTDEEID